MNVLLTGGTGYIGSHVAVAIAAAGHKPVLYDNLSNSRREVALAVSAIANLQMPFVAGDILDNKLLIDTFFKHKIEAVIHLAGLKAVSESIRVPLNYYKNNVSGTVALLESMSQVGIKKLVFSSSATVYGNPVYLPIDEKHPLNPTNPYGRTKLHIERMLFDLACSDPEISIVALRYFNPVGAHSSGLIGDAPNGIPNNLMPYMLRVAAGELPKLNVFGNDYDTPDGTGVRDYIHVEDLAEGHSKALSYCFANNGFNVFNLGTGRGYSVLQMIESFERYAGIQLTWEFVPRRSGDVASCYADVGRAIRDLDWSPKLDAKDMCSSAWNFQAKPRVKAGGTLPSG